MNDFLRRPTRRVRHRVIAASAAAVLAVGLATATAVTATATPSSAPAGGSSTVQYAVNQRVCPQTTKPGIATCYAMAQVVVPKGTKGAYVVHTGGHGITGGYTPRDLKTIYGYDPAVARSNQLVALVDWYNDPKIKVDLKAFDSRYRLRAETARSFRVVNQNGLSSPLPNSAKGKQTSPEIALDVETVRSVCNTCRILLVEANGPTDADLATAENTAARLGATEISNSFGEREHAVPAKVSDAYNHPGVVVTVSTGDDGWYGWDFLNGNSENLPPEHAASFPATSPDVVAVGGVGQTLTGTPYIWNNNGLDDRIGIEQEFRQGAGGGGCSRLYSAKAWQKAYAGYVQDGCHNRRLTSDVSALADPNTGLDVLDRWGVGGWETIGGTSLASPMIAAMFALAGGSGDAAYPSASIYQNATRNAATFVDETTGGNSFCGGDTTQRCFTFTRGHTRPVVGNPNDAGDGPIDCSFPRAAVDVTSPPAHKNPECNGAPGLDGPTGVGSPKGGVGLFAPTNDAVTFHVPRPMRLSVAQTFTTSVSRRIDTGHVASYVWHWGNGTSTTTTHSSIKHTYRTAGTYTVELVVTDTLGQSTVRTAGVTVGREPVVTITGATRLKVGQTGAFGGRQSRDPNTGGAIARYIWTWGDGSHRTLTSTATHRYSKAGTYTVSLTVVNNTGESNTTTRRVRVRA